MIPQPQTLPGSIVQITLNNGRLGFGLALRSPLMAFSRMTLTVCPEPITSVFDWPTFVLRMKHLNQCPDNWQVIGQVIDHPWIERSFDFYRYDPLTRTFAIVSCESHREATYEQCLPLESTLLWSASEVNDRLLAYSEGRPCQWTKARSATLTTRR
ncbi:MULTISPECIES: hypothetical protein [Vibrio]|uniref:hypothetical protein n=1 Tax=Vibrio TaxID=662 RepID=UPI000586E8E3|nr:MULTISPECIES: hypothetical protein [Vibrio]AXN34688.1 hypothetical protein DVV14_25690 [Vibrio coralliilyticus]KPH25119.1 hypothetical protein ADU60_16690 [Vibrio coralliilyticus]MCC2524396.1 hypothetical protein [Vibrio coralliilyticus]MDE3898322.1 hypothetical protein [Vibrio sp. CC007]